MIEIEEVSKIYRPTPNEHVVALDGASFTVSDGEFVTIIGPSGCGKSTLLRLVAGLIEATSGRIILDGEEVMGPHPKIGMVFQQPVLFRWRTVLQNIMLPVEILHLDEEVYEERARGLLKTAGLQGFENRRPYELSGGMQQRVALVRTLTFNPNVLLMDEPFGALDALTREELALELLSIWEEHRKTVLFVTHSIREAILLGDKVVVMSPRPGRILEIANINIPRPRHVEAEYSHEFQELSEELRSLIGVGTKREMVS